LILSVTAKEALSDALRYWEPRRILYNSALFLVVAIAFATKLPASRGSSSFTLLEMLFVLAVVANVAYCAAYVVDIPLQLSAFRQTWLRVRWTLLTVGVAFAAVLAHFFAAGFFGPID
jgi:hypothetical protein